MSAVELMEKAEPLHLAPEERVADEEERGFSFEAAKLLGYTPLKDKALAKDLAQVLWSLGIPVLPTAEVKAYMDKKVAEADAPGRARRAAELEAISNASSHYDLLMARFAMPQRDEYHFWAKQPLSEYGAGVPRQALSDAMRIKTFLPEAEFHVHTLKVQQTIDPFLSVKAGKQEYYIAVWDEEFEA